MIKKEILEIIFPGAGSMLDGQKPFFLVIIFLLVTSFVYASYAALLFNNQVSSAIVFLLVILFAYNFLFLYSGSVKIVRFFREYFKMQKSA
jgi:positive regulator of sigma E activity